jgi:phosphate transport system permease protein
VSWFVVEITRMAAIDDDVPIRPHAAPTGPDVAFRLVAMVAALLSMVIVGVTLVFLILKALPAFRHSGVLNFFTTTTWVPNTGHFGVLGILENTVIIATIALFVGVPAALGLAIFINEYVPPRVKTIVTSLVDLLAALPSLLFAFWGKLAFEGTEVKLATWVNHHLSILPFFRLPVGQTTLAASSFEAGLVVGIMTIPIITSISRDVMAQVPREQCEGALALGGTRWGMIRTVILPFGRSGIIGGIILGFGRALGETIAVLFIISLAYPVNTHVLSPGSSSVSALIAELFNETITPLGRSGLVAAGLSLFFLTLLVNLVARLIVSRSGRLA